MKERSGAFAADGVAIREGYRRNIHQLVNALANLEVPLVAAVNGAAIGLGCDVACLADIRIASERAIFGATFLKLGLVPGDGGAWLLPRVIGMSRAAELLYTGQTIDAKTAEEWGLVSRVVAHDELQATAQSPTITWRASTPCWKNVRRSSKGVENIIKNNRLSLYPR